MESISIEHLGVFQSFFQEQERVKVNIRMEDGDVLSMMPEANLNHRQLRTISRCLKYYSGGSVMFKEEDVGKSINDIFIIIFKEFEIAVAGNLTQCRRKDLNEVLDIFSLNIVFFLIMKT